MTLQSVLNADQLSTWKMVHASDVLKEHLNVWAMSQQNVFPTSNSWLSHKMETQWPNVKCNVLDIARLAKLI